tara:strand:+ start:182 stop:304 length:123 start_codon:yes stop_codon:yes gene_type:complete
MISKYFKKLDGCTEWTALVLVIAFAVGLPVLVAIIMKWWV